jgi:hypothetical protein
VHDFQRRRAAPCRNVSESTDQLDRVVTVGQPEAVRATTLFRTLGRNSGTHIYSETLGLRNSSEKMLFSGRQVSAGALPLAAPRIFPHPFPYGR